MPTCVLVDTFDRISRGLTELSGDHATTGDGGRTSAEATRAGNGDPRSGGVLALVIVGAVLGAAQWWGGLYEVRYWGPAAIIVTVVAIAAAVGRGLPPSRAGRALLAALAGFAVLSAVSMLWGEARASAAFDAHRWAFYAALSVVVLCLVRTTTDQRALVLGFGVAGVAVGLVLWAEMLLGTGAERFTLMRLSEPLGYVNGQAASFLLTAWVAIAMAERARHGAARAGGAAAAILLLGLVVLTQSRGALVGFAASLIAVLAFLPGRERRVWLLILVVGGLGAVAPTLLDVYATAPGEPGRPTDATLRATAGWLGLAAIVTGGLWALASGAADGARPGAIRRASRGGRLVLAVGLAVGVAGAGVAVGNPIDRVERFEEQFTSLETPAFSEAGSRLTSSGGNRYDYWRVAVKEFRADPVAGIGAGGYATDYFRLRATPEDVRQPHSIEFQVLAELGLLGVGLLVLLLAALGVACFRAGRLLERGRADAIAAVAGVGMIAAWLAQTSVDWLHLLPGLTGMVVAVAAAILALPASREARRRPASAQSVVVVVLLVVGAAGIGRLTLADRARESAEDRVVSDPVEAVELADRALRLQPEDLQAMYVKAAALARLNRYEPARDVLLRAVDAEPSNFVPRVLLGDLAARRGDDALARRRYVEAQERNPLDPQLAPRLALVGAR